MSMDVDRPMSPAAFRSMRRTSRPHPTVSVGQEMSDVKRCQEMSRDVKRCQEMSIDVKSVFPRCEQQSR